MMDVWCEGCALAMCINLSLYDQIYDWCKELMTTHMIGLKGLLLWAYYVLPRN